MKATTFIDTFLPRLSSTTGAEFRGRWDKRRAPTPLEHARHVQSCYLTEPVLTAAAELSLYW
jgi:hypothetical protein